MPEPNEPKLIPKPPAPPPDPARATPASSPIPDAPPPTAAKPPSSPTPPPPAQPEPPTYTKVPDNLMSVADMLRIDRAKAAVEAAALVIGGKTPSQADTATPVPVPTPPRPPISRARLALLALGIAAYAGILVHSLLSGERTVTWLALISMNVVGTVGFNVLLRYSSWHHEDQWLTATILQTGLFLPFLAKEVVAPIHFHAYTPFAFLLLTLAAIFLVTLQICNVKALEHLEASVFSVIFNSRIIFATIFGLVFLSETVGFWALLGGALIFTAIFIIRQKGARALTREGIIFGLGAAVAISAMNVCEKELIKLVGYQQYAFPLFTIAAIVMWIIVLLRRTQSPFKLFAQRRTYLIMALRACAGIGFSASLIFGPVAVSNYLASLSVVLMVVVGLLFLGERDYIRSKITATVVAILGLSAILIDSLH